MSRFAHCEAEQLGAAKGICWLHFSACVIFNTLDMMAPSEIRICSWYAQCSSCTITSKVQANNYPNPRLIHTQTQAQKKPTGQQRNSEASPTWARVPAVSGCIMSTLVFTQTGKLFIYWINVWKVPRTRTGTTFMCNGANPYLLPYKLEIWKKRQDTLLVFHVIRD